MPLKHNKENSASPQTPDAMRKEIKRLRRLLSELTPDIEAILRLRGFKVYKKEPSDDLMLPSKTRINSFYKMMKRYSFRLFLRDVIKHQESFTKKDVTRYAVGEVTEDYIDYLLKVRLIEEASPPLKIKGTYRLIKRPIKSFGETLEWFLAEIFKREFYTEAIWGVKFKRPGVGGDYDLIVKINSSILYMEVKSSPPKQIYAKEIRAFIDRAVNLKPSIAVFFMDTELRMNDKIVPMFEDELKKRYASPPKITRIEKELFHIGDRTFIINAKESIAGNIEKILNWYFTRAPQPL